MNKELSKYRKYILSILGIICLLVPAFLFGLWQHAFDLGSNQLERVEIYESYLPDFLHGRYNGTMFSLAFSLLGMTFSIISINTKSKTWKALNILILVLCSLFTLLNLFWLM
jgi:hypothetical protein